MRLFVSLKFYILAFALSWIAFVSAANQTPDISPIFHGEDLPFRVKIKLVKNKDKTPFLLPNGIQAYAFGVYKDKWLFISGRTNGLHGFNVDPNNFPPQAQNRTVFVVDLKRRKVTTRSLTDPKSGLTQDQIDSLSVTDTQFYQSGKTLYITGGYGFRNSINDFTTFDFLTAIDIPGLMHWVTHPNTDKLASSYIRQISDPTFQVAGGDMFQVTKRDPTLLVFGQDFEGAYFTDSAVQVYTRQVRRFKILDDGLNLTVQIFDSTTPDENFRRRDLNTVPVIRPKKEKLHYGLVALSGVFTESGGIWTIPVNITADGSPSMLVDSASFKQGMNNYASPFLSLFSKKTKDMYTVLFGGITFAFFQDGVLKEDTEIPFTNEVTTVRLDKRGNSFQYIMDAEYPVILSTQSNPGNRLLFGAVASFIPAGGLEKFKFKQEILKLDRIEKPLIVGYIVGGIQSTLMNTNSMSDSAASPYIFKVILEPKSHSSSSSSKSSRSS